MRVWFNGRTSAFQAEYVGSIPITRFSYIIVLFYLEINIWWVWHSWLARRIVVPKVEGSNPSTHPVAVATIKKLGYRQAVRHQILILAFAGSNPASPVSSLCLF